MGGEIPRMAYRKGLGDEIDRRQTADRLSLLHDGIPDCHCPPAAVLRAVDVAFGIPVVGILRRDDFCGGLFVVCFEPVLRDQEFSQRENLVA